jgi:hypothetical protein
VRTRFRSLTCTFTAALLAATVAACGGEVKSSPEFEQARQVLADYVRLTADGDRQACDLETPELAEKLKADADGLECAQRVSELGKTMAALHMDDDAATFTPVEGDAQRQVIDVALTQSDDPTRFTLVADGGAWLVSAADVADQGDKAGTNEASGEQAERHWVESWCDLAPQMTADQAIEIMGEPSVKDAESLEWKSQSMHFVAFLDADGQIADFWSPYSHSESDLALMSCVQMNEFDVLQRIDE